MYISATIPVTWTSFPRHQSRWTTVGAGVTVSVAVSATTEATV
jgi:hypothetical protein